MKYMLLEDVVTENRIWEMGTEVEIVKRSDPFCVVKTADGWMFTTRLNNLTKLDF
jgi:hypothetical protein